MTRVLAYSAMKGLPGLRRLRTERGWSQLELWMQMRLELGEGAPARSSIGNYESGATSPKIEDAIVFADFFGVTLDDLMDRGADPVVVEDGATPDHPPAGEAPDGRRLDPDEIARSSPRSRRPQTPAARRRSAGA